MERSEQINELAAALAKAQGAMGGAVKGNINPAFRSKYADLASCWDAIREPFSANGLSVTQCLSSVEGGVNCMTMLMHTSGQWIASDLSIPVDKTNAHGYGSAATYSRRFSLQAMCGISPVDDDANAAVAAPATERINPVQNALGDWGAQHPEEMESLKNLAAELVQIIEIDKNEKGGFLHLQEQKLDNEQKLALWSLLSVNSKTRSALKREGDKARQ